MGSFLFDSLILFEFCAINFIDLYITELVAKLLLFTEFASLQSLICHPFAPNAIRTTLEHLYLIYLKNPFVNVHFISDLKLD